MDGEHIQVEYKKTHRTRRTDGKFPLDKHERKEIFDFFLQ
jgi:hypothetical protein